MKTILNTEMISKCYGKTKAVEDFSITIEPGRVVGLVGPNGAGKTTLLRLLADMIKADSGKAFIDNIEIGAATHKHVSFVPDFMNLYKWMRVEMMVGWFADMFEDFNNTTAHLLLSQMQIGDRKRINTLSKGRVEKLMIALALSRETSLYLLDEPLSNIDPLEKELITTIIRESVNENSTIIVSTHLLQEMESLFDEVIFMNHGKLLLAAEADAIREQNGLSIDEYYKGVMMQ